MGETVTLQAEGISLGFHETCGIIADLTVVDEGKSIAPLHRAPWLGQSLPEDAPRHQAHLQGDFLAAPFGPGPAGLHGPAANGDWRVILREAGLIRALLQAPISGASVMKELSLEAGHPFLYQRHLFIGGEGRLPLANHAMVSLPQGGKLSFSRKRWFETLEAPLESDPARGRSRLAYPRRAAPRMRQSFRRRMVAASTCTNIHGARRMRISSLPSKSPIRRLAGQRWCDRAKATSSFRCATRGNCR